MVVVTLHMGRRGEKKRDADREEAGMLCREREERHLAAKERPCLVAGMWRQVIDTLACQECKESGD